MSTPCSYNFNFFKKELTKKLTEEFNANFEIKEIINNSTPTISFCFMAIDNFFDYHASAFHYLIDKGAQVREDVVQQWWGQIVAFYTVTFSSLSQLEATISTEHYSFSLGR